MSYRYGGKVKTASIGVYPTVKLADAREQRGKVQHLLKQGIDPVQAKREQKVANILKSVARRDLPTFQEFAKAWLKRRDRKQGWSDIHRKQVRQSLERNLYPRFGRIPVSEVSRVQVADSIEALLARKKFETASKLLENISLVMRSAIVYGHRADNPADGIAEELIPRKQKSSRRPALMNFKDLGALLRATDTAPISPQVMLALRLVAFSASRIGNVITARWKEFDLDSDTPTWVIPRAQMKVKLREFDHTVPLGPTITNDLLQWKRSTGGKGYVFPAPAGGKHVKHETLEKVYRVTLGMRDKHSVHGWRASFSTLAKGSRKFPDVVVDLALDHVSSSQVERAYNRTDQSVDIITLRRELAEWWDAQLHAAESRTKVDA